MIELHHSHPYDNPRSYFLTVCSVKICGDHGSMNERINHVLFYLCGPYCLLSYERLECMISVIRDKINKSPKQQIQSITVSRKTDNGPGYCKHASFYFKTFPNWS